jgi:hypothetical protein
MGRAASLGSCPTAVAPLARTRLFEPIIFARDDLLDLLQTCHPFRGVDTRLAVPALDFVDVVPYLIEVSADESCTAPVLTSAGACKSSSSS